MSSTIDATPMPSAPVADSPQSPLRLSHLARVTHDAEATVDFYTRVMRMPLVTCVMHDRIPSTGDPMPYLHIFFRMQDGSTLAFFEAPGLPLAPPVSHPMYDIFDHVALEVGTVAEVEEWKTWIESQGVSVVGPTDHTIIYSIYFYDPNGIRMEITTPLVDDWNDRPGKAAEAVEAWSKAKAGANSPEATIAALHQVVANWEPTTFD